ncbi:hypothetical protein ABOM_008873 [Aspergillus bombycis]|uniref:Uncharacterized protein n=1 Tax=Aspergillus bombycis TaxID=109264 RepID=A0A1F7ZUM1_9EURO|nr:hypothetical protein ABOM_008873 [Aspergillus bombycis]OGM43156.1 hypothetical protein ABOM_008873 [Aspergillus bombycis]
MSHLLHKVKEAVTGHHHDSKEHRNQAGSSDAGKHES